MKSKIVISLPSDLPRLIQPQSRWGWLLPLSVLFGPRAISVVRSLSVDRRKRRGHRKTNANEPARSGGLALKVRPRQDCNGTNSYLGNQRRKKQGGSHSRCKTKKLRLGPGAG